MENMQLLGIALRQRKCLTAIAGCQRLAETRGRAILYKPCLFPWFEGGFVCYSMANLRVPLQGTPETDLCSLSSADISIFLLSPKQIRISVQFGADDCFNISFFWGVSQDLSCIPRNRTQTSTARMFC